MMSCNVLMSAQGHCFMIARPRDLQYPSKTIFFEGVRSVTDVHVGVILRGTQDAVYAKLDVKWTPASCHGI